MPINSRLAIAAAYTALAIGTTLVFLAGYGAGEFILWLI